MTVTRVELANHIETAFISGGPVGRDQLLAYAVGSHARPELIAVVEALPDKTFASMRALWYDLADLPVDH